MRQNPCFSTVSSFPKALPITGPPLGPTSCLGAPKGMFLCKVHYLGLWLIFQQLLALLMVWETDWASNPT